MDGLEPFALHDERAAGHDRRVDEGRGLVREAGQIELGGRGLQRRLSEKRRSEPAKTTQKTDADTMIRKVR